MEKYYTVDEVAQITGLTSRTIRTYIADGRLTGMRLGKQWRFTQDDIAALYTVPGSGAPPKSRIFKGEIGRKAEQFLEEEHDRLRVCVIADCADLSESETAELAQWLRDACPVSGEVEITVEDRKLIFSGTAAQTAKLLKLIKKG